MTNSNTQRQYSANRSPGGNWPNSGQNRADGGGGKGQTDNGRDAGSQGRSSHSLDDLNVYQNARKLAATLYPLTLRKPFTDEPALGNCLRQTAVLVMSRIAEGYERSSRMEFAECLSAARGSCSAVRAQLALAGDLGYLDSGALEPLQEDVRRLAMMLGSLLRAVKKHETDGATAGG